MIKFLSYLVEPGEARDHSYKKAKEGEPWPCIQPSIKIYPTKNPYSNGKADLDTDTAVGDYFPENGFFFKGVAHKTGYVGYVVQD